MSWTLPCGRRAVPVWRKCISPFWKMTERLLYNPGANPMPAISQRRLVNNLLKLLAGTLLLGSGFFVFTIETRAQDKPLASHQPLDPAFAQFVAAKKAQIKTMATDQHLSIPDEVWEFFDAVENGDATTATNIFKGLSQKSGRYE